MANAQMPPGGPPGVEQFEVWQRIGPSFDRTRQRTWDHVTGFLGRLPPASRVLDVMSGNGRHMAATDLEVIGFDWSRALCGSAALHGDVVQGDAIHLPFSDHAFDAAIYVAGLHGIPGSDERIHSLQELNRVVVDGAPVQMTVWSRHAPRFAHLDGHGPQDVEVPWRADGLDERRFYHLYTAESLAHDVLAAGFFDVDIQTVSIASTGDNLVATARA